MFFFFFSFVRLKYFQGLIFLFKYSYFYLPTPIVFWHMNLFFLTFQFDFPQNHHRLQIFIHVIMNFFISIICFSVFLDIAATILPFYFQLFGQAICLHVLILNNFWVPFGIPCVFFDCICQFLHLFIGIWGNTYWSSPFDYFSIFFVFDSPSLVLEPKFSGHHSHVR